MKYQIVPLDKRTRKLTITPENEDEGKMFYSMMRELSSGRPYRIKPTHLRAVYLAPLGETYLPSEGVVTQLEFLVERVRRGE